MGKIKGAIVVNTDRCKGCSLCVEACPKTVIALAKKVNVHGYPYVEAVNPDDCIGCASWFTKNEWRTKSYGRTRSNFIER